MRRRVASLRPRRVERYVRHGRADSAEDDAGSARGFQPAGVGPTQRSFPVLPAVTRRAGKVVIPRMGAEPEEKLFRHELLIAHGIVRGRRSSSPFPAPVPDRRPC